jgi:Protein of unknown function (DUF4254)
MDNEGNTFMHIVIKSNYLNCPQIHPMLTANQCYEIFQKAIDDYHATDKIETPIENPFPDGSFTNLLYRKTWIDTVQWHLEDIIRTPGIDPEAGMDIKREIDKSNQARTDTVEQMDDFFLHEFENATPKSTARINSETPAWLLDRMSILALKIYHMNEQTRRKDVSAEHIRKCSAKLEILSEQREDMRRAFDELIADIKNGDRQFKVYRQVKMYNDSSLNPALYSQKTKS